MPTSKITESSDDIAARELQLYIEKDADLYRQRVQPMILNLARKKVRGVYDENLAPKLFMYLADEGAKKYNKDFGSNEDNYQDIFPKDVRQETAKLLLASYMEEIDMKVEELKDTKGNKKMKKEHTMEHTIKDIESLYDCVENIANKYGIDIENEQGEEFLHMLGDEISISRDSSELTASDIEKEFKQFYEIDDEDEEDFEGNSHWERDEDDFAPAMRSHYHEEFVKLMSREPTEKDWTVMKLEHDNLVGKHEASLRKNTELSESETRSVIFPFIKLEKKIKDQDDEEEAGTEKIGRGTKKVKKMKKEEILPENKSMKLGKGGRFNKLEKGIEGEGYSKDSAEAIASSVGRKKYGKKKFQKMAAAGKKKENENKVVRDWTLSYSFDNSQYFTGHSLGFNKYEDKAVGMSDTIEKAFNDALTQLAMDGWDVSHIENDAEEINHIKEISGREGSALEQSKQEIGNEDAGEDDHDWHAYVTIGVSSHKVD